MNERGRDAPEVEREGPPDARPPDVDAVLAGLKGFQRVTVEHAFERLYRAPDSTRRFLVADEVGLGKTLVARGVIARAIEHLWETIERIDVVYICSNAQIARQNVRRLRLGGPGEDDGGFVTADRLTLLPTAVRDLRANKVNYVALTPGTSFEMHSSMGKQEERWVLYWLLQGVWPVEGTSPMNVFQGWVVDPQKFRRDLEAFRRKSTIDTDLAGAFGERLLRADAEDRAAGEGPGLRQEYLDLCHRFRRFRPEPPAVDLEDRARVIGRFRSLLAEVCVDALEPDLVILDEFQRFKHVLDGEDEAAELAKRLFTYTDETAEARLLLLSATPYKMYTLRHEQDEDDHYEDFLKTVEFLDPDLRERGTFRDLLARYRRELFRLEEGTDALVAAKQRIEGELRRLMCRTERLGAAGDGGGMLREVPSEGVDLTPSDVESFVALTRVGEEVGQPGVLEYWKSAPFLLNFMEMYRLKRAVVERLEAVEGPRPGGNGGEGPLNELLRRSGALLLSWSDVEAYRELDPGNARLRSLLDWVEEHELWRLLWLPPSLPYYDLDEPFAGAARAGLTKRLVFSTWTVVPKAIASLVSYHVERACFRDDEESPRNTPEEHRRRQKPLLRFTRGQGRLTGMPALALLYPSPVLAAVGDPLVVARELGRNGHEPGGDGGEGDAGGGQLHGGTPGVTLEAVLGAIETRLEVPAARMVERFADPGVEREDERWYWAAPILLDLTGGADGTRAEETAEGGAEGSGSGTEERRAAEEQDDGGSGLLTREWLLSPDLARRWSGVPDEDEESRWADHVEQAASLSETAETAEAPETAENFGVPKEGGPLGRPPEDLGRVLALMALAGPATSALRAVTRAYGPKARLRPEARDAAAQIAWAFRTLFNLPEAKAVVRAGHRDGELPYWRRVLEYSARGQLQAVLDEYAHTLRDLDGLFDRPAEEAFEALAGRMREALSLRTGTPRVDDFPPAPGGRGVTVEPRRIRNHFAIRFGAQEGADGKAGAREDQVRAAFNSPFRPFVLASTSVGQEGLDFHAYCHAVVHWNLPSNPVDLEQREGRVHRYKGHAVRKNVAAACRGAALGRPGVEDAWAELFEGARRAGDGRRTTPERRDGNGSPDGLVPYWVFPHPEGAFIERHVPALPLSRETRQLAALRRSLAVYRMVFGQPRQDDLMAYLLDRLTEDQLRELAPVLRIDLRPGPV